MSAPSHRLFVSCAPGLEQLLIAELAALQLPARETAGGAELEADAEGMWRALLGCGLGLRVLLRVATFNAVRFAQLERELRALPWAGFLPRGAHVRIKASARKSRLYHSGAIAERIHNVLSEVLGATREPSDTEPAFVVQARMERDQCVLSLDLCGSPMQQRGYRLSSGKAPLREDLARALLILAGYDGSGPLVDPLCGSGTLPIEAALMATARAPGLYRTFALRKLPLYDEASEAAARTWLAERKRPTPAAPILGGDRDPGAVRAATGNAERAHVSNALALSQQPLTATRFPPPTATGGLIACNPPYGHRIGQAHKLRDLYAALGKLRRAAPSGYRLAIVTSNEGLAKATGLELRSVLMTDLGGLKVRLYVES